MPQPLLSAATEYSNGHGENIEIQSPIHAQTVVHSGANTTKTGPIELVESEEVSALSQWVNQSTNIVTQGANANAFQIDGRQ